MSSLKLALEIDANNPVIGDIYLGPDGQVRLTQSLSEEVAQLLYTRFRFFQGEWFLDPSVGVPWFQSILGVKTDPVVVSRILRSVVADCPGVKSVDSFSLVTQPQRGALVRFSCTLDDGAVLTSDSIPPFVVGG
jgi:hypothetical protein